MGTAVNPTQLQSALKQGPPAPVCLVAGEEDLLRNEAVATLKTALLGEGGEFNFDLFYGDEAEGSEILNCASEVPVFAERRVVLVKTAEKVPAREAEKLLRPFRIQPKNVQKLDSIDYIPDLQRIGKAIGSMKIKEEHFANFL